MIKRMESEMEKWPDTDFVQKTKELEKQLEEKELQEYNEKIQKYRITRGENKRRAEIKTSIL